MSGRNLLLKYLVGNTIPTERHNHDGFAHILPNTPVCPDDSYLYSTCADLPLRVLQ